jgi:hypothetical protein
MDSMITQDKVLIFAQHLLTKAKGDLRTSPETSCPRIGWSRSMSAHHAWCLVAEVRRVLMPEATANSPVPIRHLVDTVSWEGSNIAFAVEKFWLSSRRGLRNHFSMGMFLRCFLVFRG